MLEINNWEVFGWKGALRGMRNPYNSWDKADSNFGIDVVEIGDNDLDLCKRLIKAGSDHRKFLRMIHVQVDVKAPFFMFKELDTYKVGTVCNSCSTMHTLTNKEFTLDDFSFDTDGTTDSEDKSLQKFIKALNLVRDKYIETKDKFYWRRLVETLPCGYMQLRTYDLNYETLMRMYFARKNHKLQEWHDFCDWILTLPYMKEFIEAV